MTGRKCETIHHLVERERLKGFVRFAKGDPLLTAWEAGFIQTIDELTRSEDVRRPSHKQAAIIIVLIEKLHYDEGGNAAVEALLDADQICPSDLNSDDGTG